MSRLGNPLFNEVIVPMARKDQWNAVGPDRRPAFAKYVARPELAALLPVLYPGVFPNLAALNSGPGRPPGDPADRHPLRLIPGFQNFTGTTQADVLRLNVAIPPAADAQPARAARRRPRRVPQRPAARRRRRHDRAAGRRRGDYPLVDPTFTPDGAVSVIEDGTFNNPGRTFLDVFPFIGLPYAGYDVPAAA